MTHVYIYLFTHTHSIFRTTRMRPSRGRFGLWDLYPKHNLCLRPGSGSSPGSGNPGFSEYRQRDRYTRILILDYLFEHNIIYLFLITTRHMCIYIHIHTIYTYIVDCIFLRECVPSCAHVVMIKALSNGRGFCIRAQSNWHSHNN